MGFSSGGPTARAAIGHKQRDYTSLALVTIP